MIGGQIFVAAREYQSFVFVELLHKMRSFRPCWPAPGRCRPFFGDIAQFGGEFDRIWARNWPLQARQRVLRSPQKLADLARGMCLIVIVHAPPRSPCVGAVALVDRSTQEGGRDDPGAGRGTNQRAVFTFRGPLPR